MAINIDSFGYGADKEAKKRAAIERLKKTEKDKTDKTKGTGQLIGGALGALAAGLATGGNPQAVMQGFNVGGSLGSMAGGAVAGEAPTTDEVLSTAQSAMSIPGLGDALGMEGATEGSSISGAMKNKDELSKLKKAYSSGLIDKTKYDQLVSMLSM
jgi:hypothetical protein